VQGARVTDGTLVLTGGAAGFTTLNDYALRLETTRTVTVSLTLESKSDPGFVGLNLWNSLPPAGDATNWYSTAAKVSIGLMAGRPSLRVYDGTSNMPAYQVAARPPAPSGPVQVSVSREGDELVLRAAGAEIGRTKILGSLTGGPLFFGPLLAANRTVTIHRFAVTDAEHPSGAEIVPAVAPSPPSNATDTLKAAAANRGHDIGVGLSQRPLRWDARVREVAAREFSLFEGIDAFVFNVLRPARNQYRFCAADQIVAFAEANHVPAYAGSGLLWGRNPDWLTEGHFSRAELIDIMHEHIQTVVGRYRGRVRIWNVVNEVHDNAGGLQKGDQQIWMRVIGPEYIDMAFRWAHEADPQALLVFNSYNDEGTICQANCGPGHAPGSRDLKADGLYATVKGMLQRGVPIHGVGMQMHRGDFPHYPNIDTKSIAAQMKRLGDLGLNVYITEMDVPVQKPATAAKLADQAAVYADILRTCLAAPNCKSLIVFGVDDGNWSEPPSFARAGSMQVGQLTAPLLFDTAFSAKPAYQAMLKALRSK
jgi:endo-1,4-beta-xylanase